MATFLFHVKVTEVNDTRLELKLRIITGEQPDFYSGRGFALMLIYDPILKEMTPNAPLAKQITREELVDLPWLHENIEKYIDDAVLIDIQNLPLNVDLESKSAKEYQDFFASSSAPAANFEIIATHRDWIAHLRPGMEWDTTAYDPFL